MGECLKNFNIVVQKCNVHKRLNHQVCMTCTIMYITIKVCISFFIILETPDLELPDDLTKTICLRAGSSLRLHVTFTGRPIPAVTWSKPGVDLDNRGFIEVTDTATTLIIDKVHRYDAGKYTLEASNSAGKKDATILVKIYGKSNHNPL